MTNRQAGDIDGSIGGECLLKGIGGGNCHKAAVVGFVTGTTWQAWMQRAIGR